METLLAGLDDSAIEEGLFRDIGIVPAQFYPGRRNTAQTEPIRKLMTAILVDAVQCYRTGQRQIVKGTEALEANIWIFGSYAEFPFSFTNVCTELGLSPDRIRKQLRDSDTQVSEGGRPRMIRRPSRRTLKVKGEARRSQRPSKLRSAEFIAGFRAGPHSNNNGESLISDFS